MNQRAVLHQERDARPRRRIAPASSAVTACVLLAFAILTGLVTAGWTPLLAADAAADGAVHGWVLRHRAVIAVADAVAFVADDPAMYVLTGVAVAAFLIRRRVRAAIYLAGAKLIQVVAEPVAKDVIGRPRPALPAPVTFEDGFSFPSGHATRAATFTVCLVVLWLVASRSQRPAPSRSAPVSVVTVSVVTVLVVAVLVVATVAASRVLLGVHNPSDVLAGALLGTACACVVAPLLVSRRTG